MFALAGLVILHSSFAALFVEVLLRLWRVQDPGERAALRWGSLLLPLVCVPIFAWAAPYRASESFATAWALFAGLHWDQLTVAGAGLASAATGAFIAAGLLLYWRDAWPFLADRIGRDAENDTVADPAALARVTSALAAVRSAMAPTPDPGVVLLGRHSPVLLCQGVERPVIVVSVGTLERLDEDELRAALAHELAHARHRDPLRGWLLMAARTVAWFSPAAQIVARQIVQELEHRADLVASHVAGPAALGRAIAALSDAPDADTDLLESFGGMSRTDRFLDRAQREAVGARCDRVFRQAAPPRSRVAMLRVALASAGLATLLFFVV